MYLIKSSTEHTNINPSRSGAVKYLIGYSGFGGGNSGLIGYSGFEGWERWSNWLQRLWGAGTLV